MRLALVCALVGVAALILRDRTHLHGTHTVTGIAIGDGQRALLGDAGIVLLAVAAIMLLAALIEGDGLARNVSGVATLLVMVTVVGGALVFAAYRVQQNAGKPTAGKPPVEQVDCPVHGGTCYSATAQGGTFPGPPSGYDSVNLCTWADVGLNAARTREIYQCR
jgi:hypothetical protein